MSSLVININLLSTIEMSTPKKTPKKTAAKKAVQHVKKEQPKLLPSNDLVFSYELSIKSACGKKIITNLENEVKLRDAFLPDRLLETKGQVESLFDILVKQPLHLHLDRWLSSEQKAEVERQLAIEIPTEETAQPNDDSRELQLEDLPPLEGDDLELPVNNEDDG